MAKVHQDSAPEQGLAQDISVMSQPRNMRSFLIKTVSGTFGLKVLNVGLVYANSVLIARLVGAAGYGEYIYTISWIQILLIPAALGFEGLINRELAVYVAKSKWGAAKGLLQSSNLLILGNAVLVAVAAVVLLGGLGALTHLEHQSTFWLGLLLLPILALSRLRQYALQALHKVLQGTFPDTILRPLGLVIILGGYALIVPDQLSATVVMGAEVLMTFAAFCLGTWFLTRSIPRAVKHAKREVHLLMWIRQALPMLLIGSMYVINQQTDSVMLGLLQNSEQVGIYAVVNRGSGLLGFIQIAFSTPLAAVFATLYAQGQRDALQSLVTRSCQASLGSSFIFALALWLGADLFLQIFGPEFLSGRSALLILTGAQLVNAATGAVAMLLIMTGFDGKAAWAVGSSALINIILNAWLIPEYGINGAAIATGTSLIIWNILMVYFSLKHLRVRSLPI